MIPNLFRSHSSLYSLRLCEASCGLRLIILLFSWSSWRLGGSTIFFVVKLHCLSLCVKNTLALLCVLCGKTAFTLLLVFLASVRSLLWMAVKTLAFSLCCCGKSAFAFSAPFPFATAATSPYRRRGGHTQAKCDAQRLLPCFHAACCVESAPISPTPACYFSDRRKSCGRLNDTRLQIRG